jgi:hypothetical protein
MLESYQFNGKRILFLLIWLAQKYTQKLRTELLFFTQGNDAFSSSIENNDKHRTEQNRTTHEMLRQSITHQTVREHN